MTRVGVISDTHSLLRPNVLEAFSGVDRIIHAGDVGAEDVLTKLQFIAPVTAVRGNVDISDWAERLPFTASITIEHLNLYVVHRRDDLKRQAAPAGTNVVIYGHSHKPDCVCSEGIWYLNPGSAGKRRFSLPVTLAVAEIDATGSKHHLSSST